MGSRPSGEESMQINEAKSAELLARLETLPFSKWHRNFFILGFVGVMFDAADFALFGRRIAADCPRVRTRLGAVRSNGDGRARRRLRRRTVLGNGVRLYRPAYLILGDGWHLRIVYRPCCRVLERRFARGFPFPLEFRPWRRGAGHRDARRGIQPRSNPRRHGGKSADRL